MGLQKRTINFLECRQALEKSLLFLPGVALVKRDINDQGFNLIMVDQNGAGPGLYRLSMGWIPFQKSDSQDRISQNQQFRDPPVVEIDKLDEQLRRNRWMMFCNDLYENLGNNDILNNSRILIRGR